MKARLSSTLICLFFFIISVQATAIRIVPSGVAAFSDSILRSAMTGPGGKAVEDVGRQRLSWSQNLISRVNEKTLGKKKIDGGKNTPKSSKVLSIVSLATALVGGGILVTGVVSVGLLFSFVGLITGIVAFSKNKSKKHRGLATLGILVSVISIISIILAPLMFDSMFSGASLF